MGAAAGRPNEHAMGKNRSSVLIAIGVAVFVVGAGLAFLAVRSNDGGIDAPGPGRSPDRRAQGRATCRRQRRWRRAVLRDPGGQAGRSPSRSPMSEVSPASSRPRTRSTSSARSSRARRRPRASPAPGRQADPVRVEVLARRCTGARGRPHDLHPGANPGRRPSRSSTSRPSRACTSRWLAAIRASSPRRVARLGPPF